MRILPIVLLSLLPFLPGCVMVSFHTLHPVEVQVRHKGTRKSAADALVKVEYSQRPGYGVFYVLRVPKDTSARTNDQGIAHMRLADFANHRMSMRVNGDSFFMTNELVFKGGTAETPADYFPSSPPANFTVSITPEKR